MNINPQVIVCPVFDGNARSAIKRAAELARTFDAKLLILNVIDNTVRSLQSPGTPFYRERRLADDETIYLSVLNGITHEQHELIGEPTVGIRNFVIRKEADLVVLGNASPFGGSDSVDARTRRIADSLPCTFMVIKDDSVSPTTPAVPQGQVAQTQIELTQA